MLKDLSGWVFGDKGYLMNDEKLAFIENDGQLGFFAKPRSNTKKENKKEMPLQAKKMARKRPLIETVIEINKAVLDLEQTRHRKETNAFTHVFAGMCAYSFYRRKPKANIELQRLLNCGQINTMAA
jgi:uncharacterized membrane protein YcaP (DUF421 family)